MGVLNGKTAIVTGASRGIGAGIARTLASQGARVVVNYRSSAQEAESVVAELRAQGHEAVALQADVTQRDAVVEMVEDTLDRFGAIDILVNNAGVAEDASFRELSPEAWDRVIQASLYGTFYCSQVVAAAMAERHGGAILNISAAVAIKGRHNGANFCAAKAGVMALTKCMALELAPGIRVNCLCPGFTPTQDVVDRFGLDDPQVLAGMLRQIPMGRLATTEDIARVALFLLGPDAAYITGHVLFANGGMFMH